MTAHSTDHAEDGSLLRRLRQETSEEHRRLESDLALVDGPVSQRRYADLLGRFHGFHAAHEPLLDDAFAGEAFWPPRRRLGQIEHDLHLLGWTEGDVAALPRADVPAVGSRAAAFGYLYVFEGATLGGRVIARHLSGQDDVPRDATAYFAGRGREAGTMWRETCALLAREVPPAAHAITVATAGAVFASLRSWLMPAAASARETA